MFVRVEVPESWFFKSIKRRIEVLGKDGSYRISP